MWGVALLFIQHSSVVLFGRSVALYGLIAVLGAALVTVVSTLLARRRGINASLAFRLTMLFLFGGAAFHVFLQDLVPGALLNWSYVGGVLALPLLFGISGHIFGADRSAFTELGIVSVLAYSVVTRLCCTFGGCCYGPPWSGGLALVYGVDTHNPLPGVALFPLQPLMALFYLGLAIWAAILFARKRPQALLWIAVALNLAGYAINIFVSPMSAGRETEALCMLSLSLAAALGLLLYYMRNKPKGANQNAQS